MVTISSIFVIDIIIASNTESHATSCITKSTGNLHNQFCSLLFLFSLVFFSPYHLLNPQSTCQGYLSNPKAYTLYILFTCMGLIMAWQPSRWLVSHVHWETPHHFFSNARIACIHAVRIPNATYTSIKS